MKVGIDLENNGRFKKLTGKDCFMRRVYGESERRYIAKKGYRAAAGIFCVKEAFAKALGVGILNVGFHNISVEHGEKGKPYLVLSGRYSSIKAEISISHSGEYTSAVCIIED